MKNYCVLILGMHRSGTSALSRHILNSGFSRASKSLPLHPDDNSDAYSGSREVVMLNREFMNEAGIGWNDVNPLPSHCFTSEIATRYRHIISDFLQSAFRQNGQIVINDPQMCRLLPLWLPVLKEQCHHLATIFVLREAGLVHRALAKRRESKDLTIGAVVDRRHAIALWLRHNIEAELYSQKLMRLTLCYEQWLAHPSPIAVRIRSFLQKSLPGANLIPAEPEPGQPPHMASHHPEHDDDMDRLCKQTYEALLGTSSHEFLTVLRNSANIRFPSISQDEMTPPPQEIIARAQLKHITGRTPLGLAVRDPGSLPDDFFGEPIIFISDLVQNPCHIYRVKNMVDAINDNRGSACWTTSDQAVQQLPLLCKARLVILHRCLWNENINKIYGYCKKHKITTAYDIDDLIFEPKFVELGYIHFISQFSEEDKEAWVARISSFRKALIGADFCITSTPAIRAHLRQQNVRAVCIPNGYSEENVTISDHWRAQQTPIKPVLRLGYASGSPTHAGDFALIAESIAGFLTRHNNWILTIVGTLDMGPYRDLFNDAQVELRPSTQHINLAYELTRFDINLIPLERNPFCDAKSPLKWYEAALCGVPSIATNNLMYTRLFRDGESGLLASSPDDWLVQLETLAGDESLRLELAERARKQCRAYGPDRIAMMFRDAEMTKYSCKS